MIFRRKRALPLALSLLCVLFSFNLFAQLRPADIARQIIPLDSGWQFHQRVDGPQNEMTVWRAAQVPGDVHLDLLRHKLIPDPYYRDNEAKLQWIENADWEYRTTMLLTPDVPQYANVELVFDGLDAYAEVYLNGQLVLTADNMFRTWRVDAKPYLKPGANQLLVVFPSPIKAAAKIASTDQWRSQTHTEEKTYVRKAAYEYGWDWGPRFVTSGIWKPVKLDTWDQARISDFHIRQRDVTAAVAHLTAELEVTASENTAATVTLNYVDAGKKMDVAREVELHTGVNHVDFPIEINQPKLWYPAGYGAQPLYEFKAQVKTGGRIEDEGSVRTGLRSVVLRREPDQWGRSFEFVVNGIPIFGKGADVIPFDSFPNRVTTEQYRSVLQSAKDANMNMIRHWGGGYYESDEFYEICDELGIMIWQDFMFGNDWQPGTYAFKQNVAQEAEDQVRRLRNHPSLVIWCGNNETESAFNWDGRPLLSPAARLQMWQDYLTVFSGILARTVERLSPETPYWPSSPSADYEETSESYQTGDMHDWSVWHGRVPFSTYEKHFGRFTTEYGFQSFPEMRTVETFTVPEDRTGIFTPVMLAHQKNNEGNAIIHDYMLRYYSEPKDFASFPYASQVLQAEGIKTGAEHLRRNRPRTMGSLYWQLNDCWPVASWSSLDYYGRWKALQYYARRFYNDLLVSPHEEKGGVALYVVSDRTTPTSANLRVRLMTFEGTVLAEKSQALEIPALSSKVHLQWPMDEISRTERYDPKQTFLAVELIAGGKPVSSNLLFFAAPKDLALPSPQITSELRKVGDSFRLRLRSPVLARSVSLSFGDADAKLSDDYFDLLPGQAVEVEVKSATTFEQLRGGLKIMSLADAFQSAASGASSSP
jgi:beta-mannosidase